MLRLVAFLALLGTDLVDAGVNEVVDPIVEHDHGAPRLRLGTRGEEAPDRKLQQELVGLFEVGVELVAPREAAQRLALVLNAVLDGQTEKHRTAGWRKPGRA